MPIKEEIEKLKIQARNVVIDHPDANKDWGHGITANMLDAVFKEKLAGCGHIFVQYSNIYKVNPAFMASISCHETGYGTSNAIRTKNNCFGMMTSNGFMEFDSLQEGIRRGISNLSRNYMNNGKTTLQAIQAVYCPVGAENDPNNLNGNWQSTVKSIYKKITGKNIGSGTAFFGTGVKTDPLSAVTGGFNGNSTVGDGTGSSSDINFDNREDLENLTDIKGVVLSYLPPHHMYSVKNHASNWEKDKYDREFHYGIDSSGITKLKEDNLIANSMQDNNMSTYINRALFSNKAIKNCISIGLFTSESLENYAVTEKKLIRNTARVLHKYNLETKDLWREFDLNRAASPILYLDRIKWKAFLREVDKQLVYLQNNYPQDSGDRYETHVGMKGKVISSSANVRNNPDKNADSIKAVKKDEQYNIIGYSNTWYQLDISSKDSEEVISGWIEVKHVNIVKDFLGKTPINQRANLPEIDEDKMPEIENILTHSDYLYLLSYSSPMFTDNYAGMHEPYDKNLPEIINSTITDDDRMASMTTTVKSLEENKLYYSLVEASSGDGDHCKRAPAEMNGIWKSEDLKVEPIYPDLIIPPKYTTADQNISDPNALPPGVFAGNSTIADYLSEDYISKNNNSSMYKITMFDYEKVKRSKSTTGKPVNYADPYPYDDKIHELEKHHPKVKIDEIESRLYDCNHIGCPIGQPMAQNFHMLNNAMIAQSKRTEKRLVKLENTLAFVMRNLGRLGSRMHINCVYYGGQDTFGKYKTIRCLKDDRLEEGCSMTIDQCLSCTRYEPILGQIYEILDATGMNGAFITDDEQMSYNNAIDFNKLDNKNTEHYANLADNSSNKEYQSLIDLWKEIDKDDFEKDLREKYEGKELEEKLKAVKEHEYLFKMDWDESVLETQEPDVKAYPLEGIKAKYKVKPLGDKGETVDAQDVDEPILDKTKAKTAINPEFASFSLERTVSLGNVLKANAEYTGYYPTNDPNDTMNWDGDPYTANGTLLDPKNKNTCAAPKEIPFGTKIRVSGTGTDRDGLVYEVTDRGGAIKYDSSTNTYKIDLCLMDKAACKAFGRRKGTIEIGIDGSTSTLATSGSGISSVGTPIIGTSGGNVTVGTITGVTVLGPDTDSTQLGDTDVTTDEANYNKIMAGEWVDTRETADTHEINKYTSQEFYFEGFGTNLNGNNNSSTNILGQGSAEIRQKICDMALKIVDDHVTKKKAWYSQAKRTSKYVADQPGNEDKNYYYDCSSLVSCCYNFAGLTDFTNGNTDTILSHARKEGAMIWAADKEGQEKALPGDVILIGTGSGNSFDPNHVVVWLGKDEWAHASSDSYPHPKQIRHDKKSLSSYRSSETKYFCRSAELVQLDAKSVSVDGTGQFDWPVPSSLRLTSPFGKRNISNGSSNHKGIDIGSNPAGTYGCKVVASDSGTVTYAASMGSYGKLVKIDHGNGFETRYAHLNDFAVKKGAKVTKGQVLGEMGATGGNYAIHLHFEIRKDGNAQDPEKYLTHVNYKHV